MSAGGEDQGGQRLDHVGIAVRNLDERLRVYTKGLGLKAGTTEEVASEKVRVAFLPLADTRLELLEPTSNDSAIARFLERRGEGIHHICIAVHDLVATLEELKTQGVPLVDEKPRPGAEGSRVAFVHPSGTGGVLIELKESPDR